MGRGGSGVEVRATSIRLAFTADGKAMRETLSINGRPMAPSGPNIKHAMRVIEDIREKIGRGTFRLADYFPDSPRAKTSHGSSATLAEMGALWLKGKGRLATKTRSQYAAALTVWLSMFGADKPIASLSHGHVAAKIGAHPWASAKLLNNYLIVLRGVFALAARELKIDNPMDGIENSRHQAPQPDPFSPSETAAILGDMRKHHDARVLAYFEFAFATGMRPEEIIALRWSDIDWNLSTIRVERAKSAGEVKPLKTYQSRDVDLAAHAMAALKSMKAWTFMADKEIFQNPVTGRPWHDERSQRDHYWRPSLRRLGIRWRKPYNTRHTYATTALAGQVNPGYVARQMGHKSAKMLFSVYSKWIDGADQGRERAKLEVAQGTVNLPGITLAN